MVLLKSNMQRILRMTFDQLVYFIEAAKQEHIGRAARSLHVSASTVSHAVALLEQELGYNVFDRVGKTIQLTSVGKEFLQRSEDLVRDFQRLREDFSEQNLQSRQHLRIGASHDLAPLVAQAWGVLFKADSRISCELFSFRSSEVFDEVLAGRLDLGFCYSPTSHPKLNSRVLVGESLVIAVSANHELLPVLNSKNLKLLSGFPAALPKVFAGIEVCESHPELEKHKLNSKAMLLFDNYEVGIEQVASSNAWGLFPKTLLKNAKNLSSNHLKDRLQRNDRLQRKLTQVPLPSNWNAKYTICSLRLRGRSSLLCEVELENEVEKLLL
jgi:DNA-binding transcriptional LysR family regulator